MMKAPSRAIALVRIEPKKWHELGSSQAHPRAVVESAENSRFIRFKQREIGRPLMPYPVFACIDRFSIEHNAESGNLTMPIPFYRQG
jgi:hypothetical protein